MIITVYFIFLGWSQYAHQSQSHSRALVYLFSSFLSFFYRFIILKLFPLEKKIQLFSCCFQSRLWGRFTGTLYLLKIFKQFFVRPVWGFWLNFRGNRDGAWNKGPIWMGMVFSEMAYLQVNAHSRFFSLPCLLLRQFMKTFTPQIPRF